MAATATLGSVSNAPHGQVVVTCTCGRKLTDSDVLRESPKRTHGPKGFDYLWFDCPSCKSSQIAFERYGSILRASDGPLAASRVAAASASDAMPSADMSDAKECFRRARAAAASASAMKPGVVSEANSEIMRRCLDARSRAGEVQAVAAEMLRAVKT